MESRPAGVILDQMKPWHAVALVTLGWFLMIPPGHLAPRPANHKKPRALKPDLSAPLNGWYPLQSYVTEIACHEGLRELSEPSLARDQFMKRHSNPEQRRFLLRALPAGKCIAADDPRIKGVQ